MYGMKSVFDVLKIVRIVRITYFFSEAESYYNTLVLALLIQNGCGVV